jgi:hypothetical protein
MADFFKGLTGGFQTGLQLGEAVRARRQRDALADAYAAPEQLQGYTAEQGAELEAAAKSGLYDIGMRTNDAGEFQGYTVTPKASPEMQGIVAPSQVSDYRGTRVQGQFDPAQLRGLQTQQAAQVYREMGDPARAAELEQSAADMEFKRKTQPMQLEQAELGLKAARRTEEEAAALGKANQFIADFAATGQEVTTQVLQDAARQTGANFNSLLDSAAKQLGYGEALGAAAVKKLERDLSTAAAGGVTGMNKFLADSFDPDKTDNIAPEVIRDGSGNYVVSYGGRVLPEYGAHKSLDFLVATVQGRVTGDPLGTLKTLADIEQSRAAARASDATVNLRGAQSKAITDAGANATQLAGIQAEFDALTPEQKVGPEGQALIQQFNMVNAKVGGQVGLGKGGAKAVTPKERLDMEKTFVDMGYTPQQAKMEVEQRLGIVPAASVPDPGIQKLDAEKGGGTQAPRARGPQDISPDEAASIKQSIAELDARIAQARNIASAAAKSNDVASIKLYGGMVNELESRRAQLTAGLNPLAKRSLGLQ